MELLLNEMKKCVDAECYIAALHIALVVPDICGALESDEGRASRQRYKEWVKEYLLKYASYIDSDSLYKFRCAMLHQNRNTDPDISFGQIIFIGERVNGNIFHANYLNDILQIDVGCFVEEIISATKDWMKVMSESNNNNYIENSKQRYNFHRDGISPYIKGFSVYGID